MGDKNLKAVIILQLLGCLLYSRHTSAGALIDVKSFLKNAACGPKIEALTQDWKVQDEWREDAGDKDPLTIKAPTNKIGVWVVLEKINHTDEVRASRLSAHTRLDVSWTTRCEPQLKNIAIEKSQAEVSNGPLKFFSDEQLEQLVHGGRSGIIYAFSPYMHLSVEGIEPIVELAKTLNLDLTILVDPSTVPQYDVWKTSVKVPEKYAIVSMSSLELVMRGMGVHYPVLIVYSKDGKLSGVCPGRKSSAEYTKFIKGFLK